MRQHVFKFDTILGLMVLILLIFGLVMITSIGVPKSIQLSAPGIEYPNCGDATVDCYLLFKNHLKRLIVGLIGCLIFMKIPFKFWERIAKPLFFMAIGMLFLVLIVGKSFNTFAQSWFHIFETSIQPSEFAKLALIFYFATWADKQGRDLDDFQHGFLRFCAITAALVLPILLQPDLGSTLVIACVATAMYFVAGAKVRHIALGIVTAIILSSIIVLSSSHVKDRFSAFLASGEECAEDYCWQSEQASIAIGSGGFWGKGLTQGVQKSYWLPQASDDFIFAASAEELGFLRISLIVIVFAVIAYRGFYIANHAPNKFAMITAAGITTWIVAQAFINIAVNTGLMPVTGITLPFISYGGSSLLATLLGIGVLLNISKYTTHHAYRPNRGRDYGTRFAKHSRYRRA